MRSATQRPSDIPARCGTARSVYFDGTMEPLDRDRAGRPWLYATPRDESTAALVGAVGLDGPTSDLTASNWALAEQMFSEVALDFPLPDYFGHNWDALNECVFTESFEGRLIVIRDVPSTAEPNLARFVDLFEFVWLPERDARDRYPSLFDARLRPGRVALVVTGLGATSLEAEWPGRSARRYHLERIEASGDIGEF